MFKPSEYQEDIWEFIEYGSGNGLVNAVAGSGKTTTIVKGLEKVEKGMSTSFLAFNKSIVSELKGRVEDEKSVKTFHSLGLGAIKRRFPKTNIDGKKVVGIVVSCLKKFSVKPKEKGAFIFNVSKMVDMIRLHYLEPNHENILALGDKYGLMLLERDVKAVIHVLGVSNKKVSKSVDFVDMVYQPVKLGLELPKKDFVFVDEAQDLSVIQKLLFQKTIKRNGRFIAVGDPHQAIYGFAGADSESFNALKNIENTIEFPLSVSYRCGRSIINKAKTIVPHIEHFSGAGEGVVRNGLKDEVKGGDMVLCRNNKLLTEMCLEFFDQGRKASIRGVEFGNELKTLIRSSDHRSKIVSGQRMDRIATNHYNNLKDFGVERPEKTNSHRKVLEKIFIIRNSIFPKVSNTDEAIKLIDKMFNEKEEHKKIILSTIHKAKGLESNRVHIAGHDLMPSPFATEPWEKVQEKNLQYVAYTRAKKELTFLVDTLDSEKGSKTDEDGEKE